MNFITQALAFLKSHWISVLALLTAVWAYAAPTVTTYVQAHPHVSFWFGLASVVVAFYLKSPVAKTS